MDGQIGFTETNSVSTPMMETTTANLEPAQTVAAPVVVQQEDPNAATASINHHDTNPPTAPTIVQVAAPVDGNASSNNNDYIQMVAEHLIPATETTNLNDIQSAIQMQSNFVTEGSELAFVGEPTIRDGQFVYILQNEHGEQTELCFNTPIPLDSDAAATTISIAVTEPNQITTTATNQDPSIVSTNIQQLCGINTIVEAAAMAIPATTENTPTITTDSVMITGNNNQQQSQQQQTTTAMIVDSSSVVPMQTIVTNAPLTTTTNNITAIVPSTQIEPQVVNENWNDSATNEKVDDINENNKNIEDNKDNVNSINSIPQTNESNVSSNDLTSDDKTAKQDDKSNNVNNEKILETTPSSNPTPKPVTASPNPKINLTNKKPISNSLLTTTSLNNQLAKSPRTYSRTSNIVWLSLPGMDKSTPQPKMETTKKLTTTIEIANDIGDDFLSISPIRATSSTSSSLKTNETTSSIFNRINTNNNVNNTNTRSYTKIVHNKNIPENVMVKLNLTAKSNDKNDLFTINYSNNKKSTILNKSKELTNTTSIEDEDDSRLIKAVQPQTQQTTAIKTKRAYNRRQKTSSNEADNSTTLTTDDPIENKQLEQTTEEKMEKTNKKRVTFSDNIPKNDNIVSQQNQNNTKVAGTKKTDIDLSPIGANNQEAASSNTSPVQSRLNFPRNDRRNRRDFCDYTLNDSMNNKIENLDTSKSKDSETSVKIRIQPECRDEWSLLSLYCEYCNFKAIGLKALLFHRETCQQTLTNSLQISNLVRNNSSSATTTSSSSSSKPEIITYTRKRRFQSEKEVEQPNKILKEMEKSSDESPDNNDDDELPSRMDLDDQPADNESLEEEEEESDEDEKTLDGYHLNDVVWVETKAGHWPSLIMDILMNEKKLSLRLIDCPVKKESVKAKTESVIQFNKPSVDKFLKLSKKSNHHELLLKTVQKVEDYLRKRCLGTNVNPVTFFNFIEFFPAIPLASVTNETTKTSEQNGEKDAEDRTKKKNDMQVSIDGASIYQFIKEGNIEAYLLAIHKGAENERHRKFFERKRIENENNNENNNNHKEQEKDTNQNGNATEDEQDLENNNNNNNHEEEVVRFGPIKDEEQQDDLFLYLSKLYEDCLKQSNEKISTELIVPYIYAVWIPEAIVKAISKTHGVDMKKAEELFLNECS